MALRHDQQTRQLSNASSCICGRPSRRLMISRLRVAMLCFNYVCTQATCILPPPASESSSQECQQARASQRIAVYEQECVCKGKWRKGKSAGKCSVNRAGLEKKKKKCQVCGKWGRGCCGALSSTETGGCCLRFPLWGREVLLMATFWKVCFSRLGAAAHEDTWAHKQDSALPSLEAWNSAHYLITACLLPLISR